MFRESGRKGKPLERRLETKAPRPVVVTEDELREPRVRTVLKIIYNTISMLFHDPVGMLLGSGFVLLMLWGSHGNLRLLGVLWDGWEGPGSDPTHRARIFSSGIPWDQEWLSFLAGAVLLVLVPTLLIKFVFRRNLRDFGLGPPRPGRMGLSLLSAFVLLATSVPAFYVGSRDADMRSTYPLFRGEFSSLGDFALYEAGYFLFFVAIEFIFRGYLLFGLFHARDTEALPGTSSADGPLVFGYYAIFISMLSYTAWHLGKPLPELWGTLVWGIAAGTIALATGTIWPIIFVHWLLNVFLDWMIQYGGV